MSVWTIIIMVVAIAMVVGPIALLQPSRRDKHLTALRQSAAQKGIRVRLASLTLASGKQSLAVYSMNLPKAETPRVDWLLIQQSLEHELHFLGQWDWGNKTAIAPTGLHAPLQEFIQALDTSIVGIEVTKHSVAVYWSEERLTIDQLEALLLRVKELVVTH